MIIAISVPSVVFFYICQQLQALDKNNCKNWQSTEYLVLYTFKVS